MPSKQCGPEPLGPETIVWKYFGDWRSLPLALWAGSMQNMHPGLGAGVQQHSRFFDERWERLFRSLYPIGGVVYDGPGAERTAHQVRDYHRTVRGVDAQGRRYSALEPETWFWAHATFLMLPVLITDHFERRPLTPAEKEAYYQEALRWYRLYGVSDRAAPGTWAGFEEYFDRMCREVLEDNWATRAVLDVSRLGPPPVLRRLPDGVWALLRRPATAPMAWLAVGLWPEPVRRRLGYRWTRRDELLLRLLGRVVAEVWRLVPFRLRYHARARAGWARARGEAAPIPETPARYLPPAERLGEPTHYVPERYRPAGWGGGR